MSPVFISYFTPDDLYTEEAAGLQESLRAFDLEYGIVCVESRGSWKANTSAKARFVLEALARLQRPVVWIDADARVKRRPLLFDHAVREGIDFAAHYRDGDPDRLLSGSVFVNYTEKGFATAKRWAELCAEHPEWLDQGCLRLAVEQVAPTKLDLPIEYCFIFDSGRESKPDAWPVILHRQASRRALRKVSL